MTIKNLKIIATIPSICPSVHLSICLSVRLSICLSVYLLNDRVDADGNVETTDGKRDTPCSGCARNSQEIHNIWAKLEIFERSCQSSKSHQACTSCEALSSRVKELKEEHTSLLTTIKLLSQDHEVTTPVNNTPNNDEETWVKVTRKGRKSRPTKQHGTGSKDNRTERRTSSPTRSNQPNRKTSDSRSNGNSQEDKRKVVIVGDSMTKHIDPRKLSKSVLVKSHSFSGATIEDLEDHVKPVLRRKPDSIILHAGTNNLQNDSPRII